MITERKSLTVQYVDASIALRHSDLRKFFNVIGSVSGYPIEHSFLKKMKDFWFSPSEWLESIGA